MASGDTPSSAIDPRGQARALDSAHRLAVDFDGVLFDQVPHIIRGFQEIHGVDISPVESWQWNLAEHPAVRQAGLTEDEVWQVFRELEVQEPIHRTEPLEPYALDVMAAWQEAGHVIHIVTSRPARARKTVRLFLEHNDVPHHDLHLGVHHKTRWDVLIDDLPINVERAVEAGRRALLFDQPYNRDHPADDNPLRVHGWEHVEGVVEEIVASSNGQGAGGA